MTTKGKLIAGSILAAFLIGFTPPYIQKEEVDGERIHPSENPFENCSAKGILSPAFLRKAIPRVRLRYSRCAAELTK